MILDIEATVEVDLEKNVNNGNRWRMLSSGSTRIAYIVKNSGRDENDNIMEMAKCILDNNSRHNLQTHSTNVELFRIRFVHNLPSLTANIIHMLVWNVHFQNKKEIQIIILYSSSDWSDAF